MVICRGERWGVGVKVARGDSARMGHQVTPKSDMAVELRVEDDQDTEGCCSVVQ